MSEHPDLKGYHPTIPPHKLSNDVLDTGTMDQLKDDFEDGKVRRMYCDFFHRRWCWFEIAHLPHEVTSLVYLINFADYVDSDTLFEVLLYRKGFDRQKLVRIL